MPKVLSIDHLSITVSDYKASRAFYGRLLEFLGFRVLDEVGDAMGWTNGKTRLWIMKPEHPRKARAYRFGDIGFHHYAFRLGSRKEVDELEAFLRRLQAKIVDPADEYYPDYYGVYFEDPDGMELEGMHYGRAKKGKATPRK